MDWTAIIRISLCFFPKRCRWKHINLKDILFMDKFYVDM